jgi:hypothetical protein
MLNFEKRSSELTIRRVRERSTFLNLSYPLGSVVEGRTPAGELDITEGAWSSVSKELIFQPTNQLDQASEEIDRVIALRPCHFHPQPLVFFSSS